MTTRPLGIDCITNLLRLLVRGQEVEFLDVIILGGINFAREKNTSPMKDD